MRLLNVCSQQISLVIAAVAGVELVKIKIEIAKKGQKGKSLSADVFMFADLTYFNIEFSLSRTYI